jgi:hypothetical protein
LENKPKQRELDDAIEEILKNDHMTQDEKAKAYGQVIQKQRFWNQRTQNTPTSNDDDPEQLTVNFILDTVPKTFKSRAERLVKLLRDGGISWTNQGEMVDLDGMTVPNSHISDLVNDLLRYRKSIKPTGRDIMARELKRLNVPQELIGNVERWRNIHQPQPSLKLPTPKRGKKEQRRRRGRNEEEYDDYEYYGIRTPPMSPAKPWLTY